MSAKNKRKRNMIGLTPKTRKRKNRKIGMIPGNIRKRIRRKNIINTEIGVEAMIDTIVPKRRKNKKNRKDSAKGSPKGETRNPKGLEKNSQKDDKGLETHSEDRETAREIESSVKGRERDLNRRSEEIVRDPDPKSINSLIKGRSTIEIVEIMIRKISTRNGGDKETCK